MLIDVSAVAVVLGATVVIGPPARPAKVGARRRRPCELVPAEAVEHEEHHAIGVERGGRQPRRGIVGEVQQGGHHVRDAGTVVLGEEGVVGHGQGESVQTIVAGPTVLDVKVSTRGDYASRALLSLALHAEESGPTSVRDIAERTGLPQPYLEQILLALKGAGIVRSKRGVGGGYILAREPEPDHPRRDRVGRRRPDRGGRLR